MGKLKVISKNVTVDAAKVIGLGLASVQFDYANAPYAELLDSDIRKLQRIQRIKIEQE